MKIITEILTCRRNFINVKKRNGKYIQRKYFLDNGYTGTLTIFKSTRLLYQGRQYRYFRLVVRIITANEQYQILVKIIEEYYDFCTTISNVRLNHNQLKHKFEFNPPTRRMLCTPRQEITLKLP